VCLVSVGVDAFTTQLSNLLVIATYWPRLRITLVIVVPDDFPGSLAAFPKTSNGIRYGTCDLVVLRSVINGTASDTFGTEFVRLIALVNDAKKP
jgi:hypothetical protein